MAESTKSHLNRTEEVSPQARIDELERACIEAFKWIQARSPNYVLDVKDTLMMAVYGTINPNGETKPKSAGTVKSNSTAECNADEASKDMQELEPFLAVLDAMSTRHQRLVAVVERHEKNMIYLNHRVLSLELAHELKKPWYQKLWRWLTKPAPKL